MTEPLFYTYNQRNDITAHEKSLNLSLFDSEDKINKGIPISIISNVGVYKYGKLLLAPDTWQIFAQLVMDGDDTLYAEMNADGTPYYSNWYRNYLRYASSKEELVTGWRFMTPHEFRFTIPDRAKYDDKPLWQPTPYSHNMFE